MLKKIDGGVCAPKGFKANGVHAGIRKKRDKRDLALITAECICSAACVYTTNLVCGAPITVTKKNLQNGMAQAIVVNSGNANTCNANGIEIAEEMCKLVEEHTGIDKNLVAVASTGVIGQPMSIEPMKNAFSSLVDGLSHSGSTYAAEAIMTTDTVLKEIALEFNIDNLPVRIGAIAKGSGMIHPNMATMLVFITTDVNIDKALLQELLSEEVALGFNMLSVDGDTSTNDMVTVLASGLAKNRMISTRDENFKIFKSAFSEVVQWLCRTIAKDGEGATKLIECTVYNADNENTARLCAKNVICSSLVKTAIFGQDANWGRIMCAVGNAGVDLDVSKINIDLRSKLGSVNVFKSGASVEFSEENAKNILSDDEIYIDINLNAGSYNATAWGCDLTYDYVKINASYRT